MEMPNKEPNKEQEEEDLAELDIHRQYCPSCRRLMRKTYNDDDPEILLVVWVCPMGHTITLASREKDFVVNFNVRGWYLTELAKFELQEKTAENVRKALEGRNENVQRT